MVFGSWIRERTRERARREGLKEGREEGVKQGKQENHARWLAWLERRQQAEAYGEEFNEPPPTLNGDLATEENN